MRWIHVPAVAMLLAAGSAHAQRTGVMRDTPVMAPSRSEIGRTETTRPAVADAIESARIQVARRAQAEAEAAAAEARDLRRQTQVALATNYERDLQGRLFRRGEIVLATSAPGAEEAARALGLREVRRQVLPAAGLTLHTFAVPMGARTEAVFGALRAARPADAIDLNFIYAFEGAPAQPGRLRLLAPAATNGSGPRLAAIIDSALPARRPGLDGVDVRSARFGPGSGQASPHALAVATVLAETAGRTGLILLAADVSEPGPVSGASAAAIAEALDWVATFREAVVVNISLTGPPNAALAAVVRRIAGRNVVIVAAAGNDGPRAEPPYPAALPEVWGVTAVDGHQRIWRRATQGPHVDFAALGVKVSTAGGEWTGTSLAAPVVAGLLLRPGASTDTLTRAAHDLGEPGRDPVYGFGFVSAP